jgi:hypothetical protein
MKKRERQIKTAQLNYHKKCAQQRHLRVMIFEFKHIISALESYLKKEEARTGLNDPHHYAYSPIAKATRNRLDNLGNSVSKLEKQLLKIQEEIRIEAFRATSFSK